MFNFPTLCKERKADEHFISIEELESSGSEKYFNILLRKMEKLGLDITDCRGRAYDGASNM